MNNASFHLYELSKAVKIIETVTRMVVARGCGEYEVGSCYSVGIEFQSCKMNNLYNNVHIVNKNVLYT